MVFAYWCLAILLALPYAGAGIMKVAMPRSILIRRGVAWAEDFSAPTIILLGALQLAGVVGLVLPPLLDIAPILAPVAAIGLALFQIGIGWYVLGLGETRRLGVNIATFIVACATAVLGFLALA